MSLKTNEEKDIFEVLVDELHKELKQAVMRNDNLMSNAKRKETMRYLIKAVKANQTEAINNMVDLNQIDERYCKAMSNASIFLSKIVVKTIDNIEKTVKYIRYGKDVKNREQDKDEEVQSAASIKSSDASLDTDSHNSSTSTSVSIKKVPEYGCSECFFKFRSFGLVKKHVEMFHNLSNKASIVNLTKNQEPSPSMLESVSVLSVNNIFNEEISKNDRNTIPTSTLHKQISLNDQSGQQFLARYVIKGFNGQDLRQYKLCTTINENVVFQCLKCTYNCNRFANFKRHLIHHQSKNLKLRKKSFHDIKLISLTKKKNKKKKKKDEIHFPSNKSNSLLISSGSSRPSLRSSRSDSKSSVEKA